MSPVKIIIRKPYIRLMYSYSHGTRTRTETQQLCTCTEKDGNVNMFEAIDKETKAIVKYIAEYPASSEYKIYQEVKVELKGRCKTKEEKKKLTFSRIFVLRKVTMFENRGFLRLDKGPRNANLSWLTAKGLIYAVQQGVIEPKLALGIMRKHKMEVPCNRNCGRYENDTTCECSDVKNFMQQQPEAFFKLLSRLPNVLEVSQDDMSKYTCLATMLGAFYLFLTDPEYYKQCCLDGTLEFGCNGIADPGPGLNAEASLMSIVKPFLNILGFDIPKNAAL